MAVVSVPTAGNYPIKFNKREAKVIETCAEGADVLKNKDLDSSCTIVDATDNTKVLAFDLAESTTGKTVTFTPLSDVNSELKINFTGSTTSKYLSLAAAISDNRVLTLPNATDTLVGRATTDTLTNKTIDADGTGNSITNIENADIKAGAAIAVNKLAALTASKAVVSDGSGFLASVAGVSATQIGYLSGLGGTLTTGGAWTQTGAHTIGITTTGNSAITLPTSGTLAITSGESHDDIVALKLRDETTAAYTLQISSVGDGGTAMAADKKLSIDVYNADRSIDLQGNLVLAGNFSTSGAFATTLTTTNTTSLTLPTTGTLATLAGSEVLENKVLEATCALVDTTDNTKTLKWNLSAQSTGVDLTVTSSAEVADRVLTIPVLGADQEFVFKDLSQTLTNKTLTSPALTSPVIDTGVSGSAFLDEDNMASDSATKLASQQSIKAYVDARCAYPYGSVIEDFAKDGVSVAGTGNALAWGTDASDINQLISRRASYEIFCGAAQSGAQDMWVKGSGLDIAGDDNDTDKLEFGMGCLTTDDVVRTVGTSNCYMRAKVTIDDVSGSDRFMIGWRKVQAYNATATNYTDYAAIGFNTSASPAAIKIMTNLNNAGESATDTTQTFADGQYIDVKIAVGDEAYLQTALDLATDYRTQWNAHVLDAVEHTAGAHAAAAISAAVGTTSASLIAFVNEAITQYVLHDDDVDEVTPAYHQATSAKNALASEAAATSLATAVTRLNDLKAKYNLHEADATSHDVGSAHTVTGLNSCNTYFQLGANGALADPTVSALFNFDTSDEIVPFIYVLQDGDTIGTAFLSNFEVLDVVTATT